MEIVSIAVSKKKGTIKKCTPQAELIENHGIKNDAIYYRTGDCIMPKEGVFAKILKGGIIKVGDKIERINK